MFYAGDEYEGGKHVSHYVDEVHVQENSADQSVHLPRCHVRPVISTQTAQSARLHLQKRALSVQAQRNLSDEESEVSQDDEDSHRAARKSWTEGADQHVPVTLLARVLDLPASRDEQHSLLFSVPHLLLGDQRTEAVPRGALLLHVIRIVALRLHSPGRVWSPVSQRVNVHYR